VLGKGNVNVVDDELYTLRDGHCGFVGGPNANKLTEIAHGLDGEYQKKRLRPDYPIPIRYIGISHTSDGNPRTVKIPTANGPVNEISMGMMDMLKPECPVECRIAPDGTVRAVPLLITKLKNVLSRDCIDRRAFNLVMIDGHHGIATAAFRLLFENNDEVLEEINREISLGNDAFQVLLYAKISDGNHEADSIVCEDIYPMGRFAPKLYREAYEYMQSRMKEENVRLFSSRLRT
jgi:hypothetical protein